jgi:hypothetical protein
VDPILRAWAETGAHPHTYPSGSWGPPAADALLAKEGANGRPRTMTTTEGAAGRNGDRNVQFERFIRNRR